MGFYEGVEKNMLFNLTCLLGVFHKDIFNEAVFPHQPVFTYEFFTACYLVVHWTFQWLREFVA